MAVSFFCSFVRWGWESDSRSSLNVRGLTCGRPQITPCDSSANHIIVHCNMLPLLGCPNECGARRCPAGAGGPCDI
jgi:hypothetical protein